MNATAAESSSVMVHVHVSLMRIRTAWVDSARPFDLQSLRHTHFNLHSCRAHGPEHDNRIRNASHYECKFRRLEDTAPGQPARSFRPPRRPPQYGRHPTCGPRAFLVQSPASGRTNTTSALTSAGPPAAARRTVAAQALSGLSASTMIASPLPATSRRLLTGPRAVAHTVSGARRWPASSHPPCSSQPTERGLPRTMHALSLHSRTANLYARSARGFSSSARALASQAPRRPPGSGWVHLALYDLLEIEPSASASDVKMAYYRLAKKYHPDTNPDAQAKEHFIQIQKAYDVRSLNSLYWSRLHH